MLTLLFSLQIQSSESTQVLLTYCLVNSSSTTDTLTVIVSCVRPPVCLHLHITKNHVLNWGGKTRNLQYTKADNTQFPFNTQSSEKKSLTTKLNTSIILQQINGVCHDKAIDFSFLAHAHLTVCMKASTIQEKGQRIIMFAKHKSTVTIQPTQSLMYIRDTTYKCHINSSQLYSTQDNTKYVTATVAINTTESISCHLFRVQWKPFLTTVCSLVHPNS